MITQKIKKHLKHIIIVTAFILVSLAIGCQPSNAVDYPYWNGSENGGMPTCALTPPTGLFPQLLSPRQFYGIPDTEYPYEDWKMDISKGVVYCANQGTILRFGKKDPNIYYPSGGETRADAEEAQKAQIIRKANAAMAAAKSGKDYVSNESIAEPTVSFTDSDIDWGKPIWISFNNNPEESMAGAIENEMQRIMGMLAGEEQPPDLPGDWVPYNHPGSVLTYTGGAEYGPTVCVMEYGGSRGYGKAGSGTAINDQMAYILTAMEDVYNTKTPYTKYNESDIQSAYWLLVDNNVDTSHCTGNGFVLKSKAEEYEKFVKEIKNGYKASLDNSKAQIIVNQDSGYYIVGPFSVTYPEHQDLSYVKALYITTDTGKTLVYDEKNNDLEILCESGATPSNGQLKTYPSSGEYFYIKFSAAKAGYPKDINLYVDFEYLSETKINYNDLRAQANIYQYFGYYKEGSAHPPRSANGKGYTDFSFDYKEYKYDDCDLCGGTGTYYSRTCPRCDGSGHINGHWEDRHYSDTVSVSAGASGYSVHVIQPYIQMGEEPVQSLTGQPLTAALEGSRTYTIHEISTPIDLTFELGGTVWVDGTAGKESNFDGLYNTATDTPMSNVKVTLYRKNGEKVAETRTDKNGKYLFEHQNAMYQYYIKFTYNGQYYEPTIYNVDRDSENWNITSKGLDILSENYISIAPDSDTTKVLDRDSFNIRFQEIGSHPLNVNGMEVFTRDELYEKGYIDEFGNLTENAPAEYAKYVEYCMMDSYTCNATTAMNLYPGFTIFVVDDNLNKFTANTKEVLTFIGATKIEILYGNPDAMHYINQGYVLREEFDLAIKKDVFNATLEINGKTQVYTYDKRQANENGDWEIQARLSDAYYDAKYSREIYREDYEYKAEDYKSSGLNSGFDANAAGVSQDKELKVYVTYKLTIRDQSETLAGRVTEIVDYYDQEYTFVPERTYLGDKNGNRIDGYTITGNEHSIYGTQTETTIPGYKNVYLTGMEDVLLDPDINKDFYVYVTFLVNKDSNRNIILDEELSDATSIGVGKENIAEINGYKTFYGSKSHSPNENNPATTPEYYGSQYDANNNLIKQGDIAGKVDRDSVPGNLNPTDVPKDDATGVQYENFEDDTDKAPNIRIILNRENSRTVDGTVWEDKRNVTEASAQVGDGIRDSVDEPGVNGVRVQLVELLENDQEYIWKEVNSGDIIWQDLIIDNSGILKDAKGNYVEHSYSISTYDNPENDDGQYIFKSFVPGNYIVRFIYGDGTSSVLGAKSTDYNTGATIDNPVTNLIEGAIGYNKTSQAQGYDSATENLALNDKSYNGQDYKSTTYQYNINNKQGVNNGKSAYENTESKTYTYNFSEADGQLYSDAKDIWIRRQEVASYSTENVTNHKAEVLASFERIPEYNGTSYDETAMESLLNEFLLNTYMIAETGVIDVNFEYNRPDSETSQSGYDNIGSSNYEMSGYYNIANLDFGLQERPKAQLKITKQVTNVRVTLANGSILFDASGRATNVLWNSHTAHDQDTENKYTISTNYDNNFMKVPKVREDAKNKGLIQLTMDEELMHGATIQVTYAITVANIGEVDYDEPKFYYTGSVANTSTLVKTTPNTLIDYVGFQAESGNVTRNNLQFNASQNPDWSVISVDDLVNNNLINSNLRANADAYTTIVKTDTVGTKALKPIIMDEDNAKKIDGAFNSDPLNALDTVNSSESVVGVQLVLSQMITSDNSSDDMTYNNLVEIVKTSNPVGRRMAYSVVGNQDPTKEPAEIDADDSQEITILPPFGQSHIYYVLGGAVALILIAGIALVIGVVRKID